MNILITGASRGVGAALARTMAASGEHQIIILARNKKKLDDVAFQCNKINSKTRIFPIQADLTSITEIEKSVSRILSITSSIDILINNAGLSVRKPFEKISPGEAEELMAVNFHGPLNLIRLLLPALVKSGNSHVVNIGSMAGYQGSSKFKGLSCYGASKAAIASLTEALSAEYQDSGITFNCLALGAVQTEMFSEVFPEFEASLSPDQIAEFIAYFALNAHNYLKGKIVPVSITTP